MNSAVYTVSCHDRPLEIHSTESFRSSSRCEMKAMPKCPVCQQWRYVYTAMIRSGRTTTSAEAAEGEEARVIR